MEKVMNLSGTEIIWESAFELMDNDLCNEIAAKMSPCTEQEYFTEYERLHRLKYGEIWELSKANPQY